jgi:zinc transport system substrate-binding protein
MWPPGRPLSLRSAAIALTAVALLPLAGCDQQPATAAEPPLDVVTAFYPLQYVAQRVGGDAVTVTDLTKPGAEPHDLELTPQQVGSVEDADLVVYLGGLQPAVDTAAEQNAKGRVFNVADAAHLSLSGVDGEPVDPHFWLDPMRLADVADAVAGQLSAVYPAGRRDFEANARSLRNDLENLDQEFSRGLSHCQSRAIVTTHAAFGYLAEAYGLDQVAISGVLPDAEPNPQDLADVADFVATHNVTTVFSEPLAPADLAETVASTTGTSVAVLDPLESLTSQSAGDDYLAVMHANLAALQAGLSC